MTDEQLILAIHRAVKEEITPISERLETIDERLVTVEEKLETIDERLDDIEESLEEVRAGTNEALKWLDKNYHNDFDRPFPVKDETAS